MAQRYESVVPLGAVTGTVSDGCGASHIVSSRPSRPAPPDTLMNCDCVSSTICGPTVVNTSSQMVAGAPQSNTLSASDGSSSAFTIVSVCGSSDPAVSVIDAP